MNINEVKICCCSLFCWFSCISLCGCQNVVTRRLVFFPPTPPSYRLEGDANQLQLVSQDLSHRIPAIEGIEVSFSRVRTRRSNTVACMLIQYVGRDDHRASTTLLYSHGNATDLGHVRGHLIDFARRLRVNVCAYDYSGYGGSSGQCSVDDVEADVEAVFHWVTHRHAALSRCLILYGQSLGSAASIYLATAEPPSCSRTCASMSCIKACSSCCCSSESREAAEQPPDQARQLVGDQIHGVILHAPFMSGLRVLTHQPQTRWYDIFPNIDRIDKVGGLFFVVSPRLFGPLTIFWLL